jgi:hypothetical protein
MADRRAPLTDSSATKSGGRGRNMSSATGNRARSACRRIRRHDVLLEFIETWRWLGLAVFAPIAVRHADLPGREATRQNEAQRNGPDNFHESRHNLHAPFCNELYQT